MAWQAEEVAELIPLFSPPGPARWQLSEVLELHLGNCPEILELHLVQT